MDKTVQSKEFCEDWFRCGYSMALNNPHILYKLIILNNSYIYYSQHIVNIMWGLRYFLFFLLKKCILWSLQISPPRSIPYSLIILHSISEPRSNLFSCRWTFIFTYSVCNWHNVKDNKSTLLWMCVYLSAITCIHVKHKFLERIFESRV